MEWPSPGYRTVIRAPEPRTAFARAISRFHPTVELKPGIHPTAVIGNDVAMGALVSIGPHAVVGDGTRIGVAASIGAGSVVGKRVVLGEGSVLHPNVTVYDNVDIGRGAILHSGAVIGADGFGYVMEQGRWQKFRRWGGWRSAISWRSAPIRAWTARRWVSPRSARGPNSTTWCTWPTIAASGSTW